MAEDYRQRHPLSAFRYDEQTACHLLPDRNALNAFTYSDGKDSESYLLEILDQICDKSDNAEELMRAARDWPSYYHLGIGRSNIFRLLDLPDGDVLELGCGCGALTRYLGEKFRSVDSIEGSRTRAQIARKRCCDLSNVKIYCGDLKQIQFDTQYDVVTLIGVLEYAPLFYSKADAYRACGELLQLAKSALKPQGTLVIAIENSIGLKYWSGCPEDHTGILFDSIHGYPVKQSPHTFSKTELQRLLQETGLPESIFYSCFPDYKFASVLLSHSFPQNELYLHNWVGTPFTTPEHIRQYSFHEGLAIRTLSRAGLLDQFANSFVIIAGTQIPVTLKNTSWMAKKISTDRRAGYQYITTLNTYPSLHIQKTPQGGNTLSSHTYQHLTHATPSPWISGDLLIFDIYEALLQANPAHHLEEVLRPYCSRLLELFSLDEVDSEGYPLLKGEALDFIPRNVVKHNGELAPIDLEWSMPGPIPADYVLFRCLRYDVIGSHHPYQRSTIPNPEQFKLDMMKRFFSTYTKERDTRNLGNELAFQQAVKLPFDIERLFHSPPPAPSLIKRLHRFLPSFLRRQS